MHHKVRCNFMFTSVLLYSLHMDDLRSLVHCTGINYTRYLTPEDILFGKKLKVKVHPITVLKPASYLPKVNPKYFKN